MKIAVLFVALAAVLVAGPASAQSVVPGCLQPDRGLVRMVAGVRECQPTEVAVALRLPQIPAAFQLHPAPLAQQALPQPAGGQDAAMVAFFTAQRAAAPLDVVSNRTSIGLAVPAVRTLARIGGENNSRQ